MANNYFQNLVNSFLDHKVVKGIILWSRQTSLPGFAQVPIYDVLSFIVKELQKDSITMRANSMAFSFFLSLFPSLIFLFTLVPHLLPYIFNDTILSILPNGNYDFNSTFKEQIKELMPRGYEETAINYINSFLKPKVGLLSVGFLLALLFSSNGIVTMMQGFEKSYEVSFKPQSLIGQRITALKLTFLMGILVVASIILIILENQISNRILGYLQLGSYSNLILDLLRWIFIFFLLYAGIAMLYRYGTAMKKKLSFFSPGATLATILSILSSVLLGYYINQFDTYDKLYGSIGIIMFIMIWIEINAFILLVGFELNSSIIVNRDLKLLKHHQEEE